MRAQGNTPYSVEKRKLGTISAELMFHVWIDEKRREERLKEKEEPKKSETDRRQFRLMYEKDEEV
jgi:hypothetical protein